MASISDLELANDGVRWKNGKTSITISNAGVSHALADPDKGLIFTLINNSESSKSLHIYSVSGQSLAAFPPPSGFSFSYLTKHPDVGIAIVAGAEERIEGWYDWHFGFDEARNKLYRYCPAY